MSVLVANKNPNACKACEGLGLQTLNNGARIMCPVCNGTGICSLPKPKDDILNMYDTTPEPGKNGLYGLELNDGLTEKEIQIAKLYAKLSRGVMLVTGRPGSGKDTWGHHLSWRVRRFFKGKKVLLDNRPRILFDYGYDNNRYFLFNPDFMDSEMDKMAVKSGTPAMEDGEEIFKGTKKQSKKEKLDNTQKLAEKWMAENEVILQNAVMALNEFKRYAHNRNPMNKTGIMLGNIVSVWRHLDILVLGMCPFEHEIDAFSILPYLTHKVVTSCEMERVIHAHYYKVQMVNTKGVTTQGKPDILKVDGKEPRPEIGVQLTDFDESVYDFGVKERQIVDFLRSRVNVLPEINHMANLNEINAVLGDDVNETNDRLLMMDMLGIVHCKCFFDIFNSKNYQNLKPRLSS